MSKADRIHVGLKLEKELVEKLDLIRESKHETTANVLRRLIRGARPYRGSKARVAPVRGEP